MNAERVIELLEARPFKPFTLVFSEDHLVVVDDPTQASLHDDGETLFVDHHRASSVTSGKRESIATRYRTIADLKLVQAVLVQIEN